MDQQNAPQPKSQDATNPVPPAGDEQPAHDAAHLRSGDSLAESEFGRLLGEIGEAMGDDWPEWVKGGLDPIP